ncbi:MAG: GWxTD domain-containing protein [Candidatus Eisenbacteria bacterium]
MPASAPATGAAALDLPREAEGEIAYFLDGVLFLDSANAPETFFCLALPQPALQCAGSLPGESGRVQIELSLTDVDAAGNRLLERSQRLDLPCPGGDNGVPEDALRGDLDRLVYLRVPRDGDTPEFELCVEDLNAVRAGLLYQMRDEKKRGLVHARYPAADIRDSVGLSGCLFLWQFDPQAYELQGGFWISEAEGRRAELIPHPARMYGLRNPAVRLYLEAYGLDGEAVDVVTTVSHWQQEAPLYADTTRLRLPASRSALVRELDVSGLAAGSYTVAVGVSPHGGGTALHRAAGEFQMLWRAESWTQSQQQLLGNASLLLTEEELLRFGELPPGEREVLASRFWVGIDGPQGDMDGPTQGLFRQRVETADGRFGGRVRGSQTDRGKVFVRFGEPDEVHKELLPRESDRIAFFLEREIDDAERSDAGSPRRRSPEETSAYEVWYYVSWGAPLLPQAEPPNRGRPLEFIFVDELGTGDYRLIHTNVFGGM